MDGLVAEGTPRLRILAGSAYAGGVRFLDGGNLRCFSKVRCLSEASSDFWKTVLADFQRLRSQPPTKPRRQAAHASRASLIRPTPPHKKRLRSHPIPGQPRSLHFYMYIYLTCSSMSVTTGFRINPSTHSSQNP